MNSLKLLVVLAASVGVHDADSPEPWLVEASDKPLLVCWSADWCHYCQRDKPTIRQIRRDGQFDVLELDYDENRELAKKYKVDKLPTYFIIEAGRLVYRTNNLDNIFNYKRN